MKTYEEFEDLVNDFILDNVMAAGTELEFVNKFKEHMKELYEAVRE